MTEQTHQSATQEGHLAMTRRDMMRAVAYGCMVTAASSAFGASAHAQATAAEPSTAQKIADHFASIKTMKGEFVQFSPKGVQTGGKFFLERPGKIRFNYDDPTPIRVIADGQSVAIGNMKMQTWDVYPLRKTPLALLLGDTIDLSTSAVRSIKEEPDLTTITLGNKTAFGDSVIAMMFDPKTNDLKQWTITDAQGKDTVVMIFNIETGVQFSEKVFTVPYDLVHKKD